MGVGMWMMCLCCCGCGWGWGEWGCGEALQSSGGLGKPRGLRGSCLSKGESSELSEGEGVLGGVSMEGIGWSLKQADS